MVQPTERIRKLHVNGRQTRRGFIMKYVVSAVTAALLLGASLSLTATEANARTVVVRHHHHVVVVHHPRHHHHMVVVHRH